MRVEAFLLLTCVAACARDHHPAAVPVRDTEQGVTVDASATDLNAKPSGEGLISGWLEVRGNRILTPNGAPFHGRGANLHDTRSCDACSWEPPHVDEVLRRVDALTDDWHANLVRLVLESYPDDGSTHNHGYGRKHWRSLLDDDDYFRDVMRIVGQVGKKPGTYVLLSLWQDPAISSHGLPTGRTAVTWKKLAGALRDMPFVMFGVVNEPQGNEDGKLDAEVWQAMNDNVAAIRSVERPEHPHIVTVQGTRDWGRSLEYYIDHPIMAGGGKNVAYETHVYNRPNRFEDLVVRPAKKLPVIIGEVGPHQGEHVDMVVDDCVKLFDLAERLEVPWIAWSFHSNCPPNLLVERKDTCGVGMSLDPSPWGHVVKSRLARKW